MRISSSPARAVWTTRLPWEKRLLAWRSWPKNTAQKVIAIAGSVTREATACNDAGIDAFFPVVRGVTTLEEAMKPEVAKENIRQTINQVFRLL